MSGKLITVKFTRTEYNHIVAVMHDSYHQGRYYGSRLQYLRRHMSILKKLLYAYVDAGGLKA